MLQYIITWCIVGSYTINVPEFKDEFGRTTNRITITRKDTICNNTKEFTDRDSAMAFAMRGKKREDICNIKLSIQSTIKK